MIDQTELVHLNKGRAKPKGRRPPSKASGLAHLSIIETEVVIVEPPEAEKKETQTPSKQEKESPKTSPKPRPKSMQYEIFKFLLFFATNFKNVPEKMALHAGGSIWISYIFQL